MVNISEYLPKWFNEMSQLNKILVVAIGIICVCIALLMFAKSFPGKVKFLDKIVNKLFPPSGDSERVRKGCKDETALNYDEDAEEGDDDLCEFEDEDKSGNKNNDSTAKVLDLTRARTFQDVPSSHDKQAPVKDMSFVDSTTGRPWSECGHYAHEWWGVDLGTVLDVSYIILQGRLDCCEKRLQGVDIYLGSVDGTYIGNTKVKTNVSVDPQHSLKVNINSSGRYLYFRQWRRPHGSTPNSADDGLTICKLYVFSNFTQPQQLTYLGSGGCVGGNQEVPEGHCDGNHACTTIGRQSNGCWHIMSGDSPSQADREKYANGLFRKTDSGYVPL